MATPVVTDQQLINSYLQGNLKSFETLIERHQKKVFTSIYILVKDKELAEDIFQDTFIKVIDKLHSKKYREEGKFGPWVVRMAHNMVIDYYRKEKHMPCVRDTEDYCIFDSLDLLDENIQDKIIHNQNLKQIRDLIEELAPEQREVVILRHYCDMSFNDIAKATNVSINTSLGRMRYALINLRKLIERKKVNVYAY